jgi:ribA/ribD-fused uncharacterized protein
MSLPTLPELSHTVSLLILQVSELNERLTTMLSQTVSTVAAPIASASATTVKKRKSKKTTATTESSDSSSSNSASATATEAAPAAKPEKAKKAKKEPKPKPESPVATSNAIRFSSASGKSPYIALSPLYKSDFTIDGKSYATVEHYVQSQKYASTDPEYSEQLRTTEKPATLRLLASTKKHPAPADWESQLLNTYTTGNIAKFGAHPDLLATLQSTTDKTLENESTDAILGIGAEGSGQNIIGVSLMMARSHTY